MDFWKRDRGLVPKHLFDLLESASALLRVGLAEVRGEEVYIRGSSAHHDWIISKQEAGTAGGKKSAEVRLTKTGSAQPKPRSTPEADSKHARSTPEADSSAPNPLTLTLPLSPPLTLPASSDSLISKEEKSKNPASPNAGAFIARYCQSWKDRYDSRPEITGKERGIAKRLTQDIGVERSCSLLEAFFQMENQWFLTKRHDLTTFEQNLNAVVQFHDTGQQVSAVQARHSDAKSHYQSQLDRIARGEL